MKHDDHKPVHRNRADSVLHNAYDVIFYVLYFVGRYLVVITSNVLCVIASLYATGSLVTLEATNFFCPSYTLEEIRQYNLEHDNQYGVIDDSCLRIDRPGLNYNVLLSLDNQVFTGKIDTNTLSFGGYIQSILYFITTIILFISTLYQTYLLVYDTIYAIYSLISGKLKNKRIHDKLLQLDKEMTQSNSKHKNKRSKPINKLCCCCILIRQTYITCVRKVAKWYFKHIAPFYYVDSKWRMLSIIFKEWFEIGIQIYALLLYGGVNIFDLKSNVLSQTPYVIESFCIIISLNCITGM